MDHGEPQPQHDADGPDHADAAINPVRFSRSQDHSDVPRGDDPPDALAKKHWTTHVGQATGHPAAFLIVIAYAVLWLTFDRATFDWNAVATLVVWTMTLFIQRTNRRDTLALHAKLDELLRVDQQARSELVRLDEQEPEAIERHRSAEVRKAGR
jgi:low affinity Fe/Cu permease